MTSSACAQAQALDGPNRAVALKAVPIMISREETSTLLAAAEALSAGRVVVRHLASSLLDAPCVDPDDLARKLVGPAALGASACDEVAALLAYCEYLIDAGTEFKAEWIPMACEDGDAIEWIPSTTPVRSPKATLLLGVADDLRRFVMFSVRARDLVMAEAAIGSLRSNQIGWMGRSGGAANQRLRLEPRPRFSKESSEVTGSNQDSNQSTNTITVLARSENNS